MKVLDKNQLKMYSYCCAVNNPLLFVDMRLGKTLVTIRWIKTIIDSGLVLIVCPYSGLFGWEEELKDEGEQDIIFAIGTKEKRYSIAYRYIIDVDTHIRWILVNPEFHRSCAEIVRKPYKVIVFDEATYLQTYDSKISQFYYKHTGHIQNKIALTGSPALEGEHQYYMLCKVIDRSIFIEQSYYQFINGNFGRLPNHRLLMNAKGSKYIPRQLAKFVFFMTRKEVNAGGKITKKTRFSSMEKIQKIYKKAEEDFILEIDSLKIYHETVWATKSWLWLRRLCSGIVDNKIIDKTKLEDLKNLVYSELNNQQIIIWAVYKWEIDHIYDLLKVRHKVGKIDGRVNPVVREQRRKSFMNRETNIIVCNPYSMKFGADFSIAETIIYFSLPVSGLTYSQSEARPISIRKNNDLLFIYLMREKSVEVSIYNSVINKINKQEMLRKIVKEIKERF